MHMKHRNAQPWMAGQGVMRHGRRIKAGFVKHRKSKSIIPTVSKQLRYALTRESVHKPVTWSEAPHTVPKYSLEYNALKKYVSIAIN